MVVLTVKVGFERIQPISISFKMENRMCQQSPKKHVTLKLIKIICDFSSNFKQLKEKLPLYSDGFFFRNRMRIKENVCTESFELFMVLTGHKWHFPLNVFRTSSIC
jgi:hypothetical protein